jgi:hypothetical protein
MTYDSPTGEFGADTHLMKLQCMQIKVLHTAIIQDIPVRDSFVYDYVTKLRRQQAEVIQNHVNENVRNIGQGEARHRKYKSLILVGDQAYGRSSV